MPHENKKLPLEDIENRVNKTRGKFELLKLREEITVFICGPEFKELSQADQNRVEDLLVKVIDRQEKFKPRDAWGAILNR
jgi:hypothetical protein